MGEARRKHDREAAEKAKMFEKNPDKFVHMEDVLFMILKPDAEDRHAVLNNCVSIDEVKNVWFLSEENLQNRRDQIRVLQAQKKDSRIQVVSNIPPLPGTNGHLIPVR